MPPTGFEPTIPASERPLGSAHVIYTVSKYGRQDITYLKLSETKKKMNPCEIEGLLFCVKEDLKGRNYMKS
jgi:hypothetical protein